MAELNIVFKIPTFCLEVTGLLPVAIKWTANSEISFRLISVIGLLFKNSASDLMVWKYRSCVGPRAVGDSACQHLYAVW